MVKMKIESTTTIKLKKGNKVIERTLIDYNSNKRVWEIRGFKPVQDKVKVEKTDNKVVSLKPKKKTRKKKWTSGLYLKLENGQNGFGWNLKITQCTQYQ